MIEIICNEENSDKSKQVTRGAAIRRPKNIKQIGEVSSDKKIYIEDYAFTYINSIAYNNPSDSQAGVLLGENKTEGDEKRVIIWVYKYIRTRVNYEHRSNWSVFTVYSLWTADVTVYTEQHQN